MTKAKAQVQTTRHNQPTKGEALMENCTRHAVPVAEHFDQRKTKQNILAQETKKSESVKGIVSYLSRGNVSLQIGRLITEEMLNEKRASLANHKFL